MYIIFKSKGLYLEGILSERLCPDRIMSVYQSITLAVLIVLSLIADGQSSITCELLNLYVIADLNPNSVTGLSCSVS